MASFRAFQQEAVLAARKPGSRTLINVSTGGGKTLAMLFGVVRAAVAAKMCNVPSRSMSLCFTPLLALQADHVAKLSANVRLAEYVEVLSLANPADVVRLRFLLGSRASFFKDVLVFLNPERFAGFKDSLIERTGLVSHILFDEVHTYVAWEDFRDSFSSSLRDIARDIKSASLVCATATLEWPDMDKFSSLIGVAASDWTLVRHIMRRENHYYHVVEEALLLRHVDALFERARMPLLVIVNSIATMVMLRQCVMDWTGLDESSVLLYAGGFSEEHKRMADERFRDTADRHVVMIATTAYALGIDANIASVILYGVPSSLAALVQGVGRAGRDGNVLTAHCTVVVDANGLRMADEATKMVLGMRRLKHRKPEDSVVAAQCTVCLTWHHLPADMDPPGEEDTQFVCASVNAACANVSRFPVCVHVMFERFLLGDAGRIDRPVTADECVCLSKCDCCRPPNHYPVPHVGDYVKVISSSSLWFQKVGQVISVSDDCTRVTVDFGGADDEVKLPHDILASTKSIVLPRRVVPSVEYGAKSLKSLKAQLTDFFLTFETSLPRAALVSESGIHALVAKRPTTVEDVALVCESAHPSCYQGIVDVISRHRDNPDSLASAAKKSKTRSGKTVTIDVSEDEVVPQEGSQSSRGRVIKASGRNK